MATATLPQTLAELRASGWQSVSVKEELRRGMIRALESGEPLFPGIVGYEDTVAEVNKLETVREPLEEFVTFHGG